MEELLRDMFRHLSYEELAEKFQPEPKLWADFIDAHKNDLPHSLTRNIAQAELFNAQIPTAVEEVRLDLDGQLDRYFTAVHASIRIRCVYVNLQNKVGLKCTQPLAQVLLGSFRKTVALCYRS